MAATEQFNKKPKQGIAFLMEQQLLSTPARESEIADFLLENPRLNKARIGEYIGDRKNAHILEAFVRYVYVNVIHVRVFGVLYLFECGAA